MPPDNCKAAASGIGLSACLEAEAKDGGTGTRTLVTVRGCVVTGTKNRARGLELGAAERNCAGGFAQSKLR